MNKLKRIFNISWFKEKNVKMATSENPDVAGCPEEYVELPVSALNIKTRLKLAKYLDTKGNPFEVELDNIPMDTMNDVTGLAKLSGQEDCLDTVDFKNQVKSPTMALLDRWIVHGVTIGKFWEYLLILQRHDVIRYCRPIIMSDCQAFLDQNKNATMAEKSATDHDSETCEEVETPCYMYIPKDREELIPVFYTIHLTSRSERSWESCMSQINHLT